MPQIETFAAYLDRHAKKRGDKTQKAVAKRVGVDPSTIGRWLKGQDPTVKGVLAVAKAYGRPLMEALFVAAGLPLEEIGNVKGVEFTKSIEDYPDAEVLGELARRLSDFRSLKLRVGDDSQDWRPSGWVNKDS